MQRISDFNDCPSPKSDIYNATSHTWGSGDIAEKRTERLEDLEDQEVVFEIASFSYDRKLYPWKLNNMTAQTRPVRWLQQ